MTEPANAGKSVDGVDGGNGAATPSDDTPGEPSVGEPTVRMPQKLPDDPPTAPTVVRPVQPRKPLPAAQTGNALEPRWKISPLLAVLSLLAALVAGIPIAAFLMSRANRSTQRTEPVPQTILQAGATPSIPSNSTTGDNGGVTAGTPPEVPATPAPESPIITETVPTETPPVYTPPENSNGRDGHDGGAGDIDREARADENRERDDRDRERGKHEKERDREEAKREREESKRAKTRQKQDRNYRDYRDD